MDRETLSIILHELRNVVGIVHAASVETREAHRSGEDLGERLDELVAVSSLATDVLRALGSKGRTTRPFDMRAAILCARGEEGNLSLGEMLHPVITDATAGTLIDLVVALARALRGDDGGRIDVRQAPSGALTFTSDLPSADAARAALAALAKRFAHAGMVLERADDNALVVRASGVLAR